MVTTDLDPAAKVQGIKRQRTQQMGRQVSRQEGGSAADVSLLSAACDFLRSEEYESLVLFL